MPNEEAKPQPSDNAAPSQVTPLDQWPVEKPITPDARPGIH